MDPYGYVFQFLVSRLFKSLPKRFDVACAWSVMSGPSICPEPLASMLQLGASLSLSVSLSLSLSLSSSLSLPLSFSLQPEDIERRNCQPMHGQAQDAM